MVKRRQPLCTICYQAPKMPEPKASRCEECNRDYMREYSVRKRKRRREMAIKYLGGLCAHCGVTEGLQFDHEKWAEKSFDVTNRLTYRFEDWVAELEKCQLLCALCHKVKTSKDRKERQDLTHHVTGA